MRVLVTGATGLIGSAVCSRLALEGHTVVGVTRGERLAGPAVSSWVEMDFAGPGGSQAWLPHLRDIDAVVNCAGVLQDSPRESTASVHFSGADALFEACEKAGVRRVIHFSAIGVDRHQASSFSATKHQGDAALMARDLDWVILRPSVVIGRSAFGASAMFRGLASLPVVPLMGDTGDLQIVALDDVVSTVLFFVDPASPSRVELELAGPERLDMVRIIALHREWLGWKPARAVKLPHWLGNLLYRAGDFAGRLGWRPPIRSTAQREIVHGAVGDPAQWTNVTGIEPRSLRANLMATPAGVQDRWFAKLYFLKPVIMVILVLFWMITAIISLTTGFWNGVELMVRANAGPVAGPGVIAGALADLMVALAIAYRPTALLGLWAAVALSAFYIVAGTIMLPELWNEPLGPLLKIWPILAAHFVAIAILKER
jgi:uncharacterized protein YbjT (DUF2867 family)